MKRPKQWKKMIGLIVVIALALSVLLLKAPLYYQARSYLVMFAYSKYEQHNSLLEKQKIDMRIPGGTSTEDKDWFPFVMTFNDDKGFSDYMGKDLSFSVLYNFGVFGWDSSSSSLFQEDSPYYNSFYGGYIVKENSSGGVYGYTAKGEPNIDEIFAVPEYDYKYLVMQSLGCPAEKLTMDILSYNITKNVKYAGYDNWLQIDSLLLVNSPDHKYKGDRRAYIQYGNPLKKGNQEDFRLVTTNGRIYSRYFPEFKSTIYLYIMSPDKDTLKKCDDSILSKSVVAKSK